MKYKAIIFDISDTLMSYSPNYAELYYDRMRKIGINISEKTSQEIGKELYKKQGERSCEDQNNVKIFSRIEYQKFIDHVAISYLDVPNRNIKSMQKELEKIEPPIQIMKVIDGVFGMLDKLKKQGYKLSIVSNHFTRLLGILKECGLADYFSPIIISEIVGIEKPDKRIIELALKELKLPATSCLYVGDQPLDILCAKSINVDVAWIAASDSVIPENIHYKEDYRIESVVDIFSIL